MDIVLESGDKSALRFIRKPLRSVVHVTISDNSNLDFEHGNQPEKIHVYNYFFKIKFAC